MVGGVLSGQVLQQRYDFAIIFGTLIVVLRSRYGCHFAGPAHRYAVIAHQFLGYLPLGGRAQPFFENKSLKAWLSIAKKAGAVIIYSMEV